MHIWIYTLLSVILVSLVSLIGLVTLPFGDKRLKAYLIYMVSFSAGAMFGDAFLHLLPEAVADAGFTTTVALSALAGIGFSFVVEKFIHWRHCHLPITDEHVHPFAMMNLVGDAVHNLIDGIIIGSSYLVNTSTGLATTLAVVFHEIPQEISDFGVLLHGGITRAKALWYNFVTALFAVLGAIIALALGSFAEGSLAFLIPFAAGNFIYVAGSDLIPELHKEVAVKHSILQLVFGLAGVGVMVALMAFG